MFQAFLIKYGEIGIKGKNRYLFEDALMRQIRFALQEVEGSFHVHRSQGRIYVECEGYYDYEETVEALEEVTEQIIEAVHSVLEKTPPELAADIADRGIVLTGGGAMLHGLEELIEEETGITTMTAEDPLTCVAIGTGKYIEFLSGVMEGD